MRFLNRRRILGALSIIALIILAVLGGLVVYINSPAFEEQARRYIVKEIERRTGGKASLAHFDLSFWHQRFRLAGLTLRGLEPEHQAPLAQFKHIDIGLNFRTLFQKRIDLFELSLTEPQFHVLIARDGRTNFPSQETRGDRKPFNFEISIENFNIIHGSALLNERQVDIDFSLANLAGLLNYQGAREVLKTHIAYDGLLDRSVESKPSIPYSLAADMDYTRATLVAHKIVVRSGESEVRLQGKFNQVLSKNISGKLDYTGNVQVPFLNYFFTKEKFAGKADVAGFLEFARGYFFTSGNTVSGSVDFEGWHAAALRGEYAYHYPEKRLSFRKMKTQIVDGTASGSVTIENLPGPSRVLLDLDYAGVDAAALARAYPWDPKYRIFSRMTGTLNGWFEGKFDRFDLSGKADFKSYTPQQTAGLVALPLDGSTEYDVLPGQAKVANGDVRFYSTAVKADGLIHKTASELKLVANSSNLKDLAFLYSDANGSGSFAGVLTGPISHPILNGDAAVENHVYGDWKIQHATGGVQFNTETENVVLRNVRVTQGESQALINGTADLDGSPVDLRIQSNRFTGRDLGVFLDGNYDGTFAGEVHVTSLSPVRLEGDVHADNLSYEQHFIGDTRGHLRYFEPEVEVGQLSIRQDRSTLTGNVAFNRVTDALKFTAHITGIDISILRPLGLPETVAGNIRQADLRGDGTTTRANVRGEATVQNLMVYGEAFPQARLEVTSAGSKVDLNLDAGRNVTLNAQIDTADAGYPFTARTTFTRYPIERIAGLSQGTLIATGNATLSGLLTDRSKLRGQGRIESAEARIQDQTLRTTRAFTFDFNADRLNLTGVNLTGQATQVSLAGAIGLTERAPLNLDVSGKVDLALLSTAYPGWFSSGAINVDGRIGGTVKTPDLRGVAHLANASLGRRGFFTSLSNVNGDFFFDVDRVTLNNITGRMGGGTVQAQGTALLKDGSIDAMNVRFDANDLRFRYPEGLRTVLDGTLILRGPWIAPLLEGSLQIQSMSYRSSFEEFLAMLTQRNVGGEPSPVNRLRLSVHVEGSRNITITNQLADVEARIDVDIQGAVDDPALTGHVEASGGTLVFQGNRYHITRGNIDFIDPLRIEPVIDVQAESEVRDYRVILGVTGRGQQLHMNLRTDPPLPELEVVSLIAGGRTREELAARSSGAVPTSEELFKGGALSILTDLLQQRVGGRLGLLGTGRVRIDPFLVGAENDPGVRLTISEQINKELSVTYSQDLSSNKQTIILVEYFISRNTSVIASRDETGALGFDVKFRKRLK